MSSILVIWLKKAIVLHLGGGIGQFTSREHNFLSFMDGEIGLYPSLGVGNLFHADCVDRQQTHDVPSAAKVLATPLFLKSSRSTHCAFSNSLMSMNVF